MSTAPSHLSWLAPRVSRTAHWIVEHASHHHAPPQRRQRLSEVPADYPTTYPVGFARPSFAPPRKP